MKLSEWTQSDLDSQKIPGPYLAHAAPLVSQALEQLGLTELAYDAIQRGPHAEEGVVIAVATDEALLMFSWAEFPSRGAPFDISWTPWSSVRGVELSGRSRLEGPGGGTRLTGWELTIRQPAYQSANEWLPERLIAFGRLCISMAEGATARVPISARAAVGPGQGTEESAPPKSADASREDGPLTRTIPIVFERGPNAGRTDSYERLPDSIGANERTGEEVRVAAGTYRPTERRDSSGRVIYEWRPLLPEDSA